MIAGSTLYAGVMSQGEDLNSTDLLIEDRGPVRWLTLNRPQRMNAILPGGWGDLAVAFGEFEASDQRVLVLKGAGDDFCAGADLVDGGAGGSMAEARARMNRVADAALTLHRVSKPTIAAVDGVAVGAGMNLALGCDIVLATDRARFSEIFVRRGLTVDFGGTWLLPRHVGLQRAKELALSGRIVTGPEVVAIGLALEVVGPHELEERATELAEQIASRSPIGQMFAKQGINGSFESSMAEALGREGLAQAICFESEDFIEGISSFAEKRDPEFKGR